MKADRVRILILLPLILSGISCQVLERVFTPAPSHGLQKLEHQLLRASPTPLPATATPTPPPTATATSTATATASSTPAPSPSPVQFNVFQDLWEAVRDDYLYSDFNGLDWDTVYDQYYQRIESGMSDSDFYAAMGELISSLGDEHSVYLNPSEVQAEEDEFAGNNNFVGIGILTTTIPERDRIVIILTFPGSPAEQAGLQSHDSILAADGIPVLDESGFRRDLLLGPSGTQVTLTVQSPGGEPRQVTITRGPVSGPIPVPYASLVSANGKRVGYILIPTFADDTIDDQVAEAIQQLSVASPLDGLILDNRHNSGGADTVARGVLSYFTSGRLGFFIDRNQFHRPLRVSGDNIADSNRVPLVVLVGPDTVSFGEIFSGILRDVGRAYLIGERTEGNIELLWGYDFEDGSRAWIARETFRPLNHPDQDWEISGITPDLILSSNWDEITTETDPLIQAALEYMDEQQ
jgi:carboxyl-terminal processing protease